MDASSPLAAVIPTLDGPTLRALARTSRPLTGREVHRLTGLGSEAGVRRVLARLVEHGLVHVTRAGASLLYTANRDHLAWPAVESLVGLRETLLQRLRAELESWSCPPLAAALFGSMARGDGDTMSDVDILLVRPEVVTATFDDVLPQEPSVWDAQLAALRERVHAWTGNRCQVYELDLAELRSQLSAGEPILAEWKRDAVHLYGERLERLLRTVDERSAR